MFTFSPKSSRVLYAGVTKGLQRRMYEHQGGFMRGFAKRYLKAM